MPENLPEIPPDVPAALAELAAVVAQLRSPEGGCPWDLAQTPESLTPYVLEEAYETVEAIRSGDRRAVAEELGDLLLQVVLQAQIASEAGDFTLADVARGISQKLVRRHPHVFGDGQAATADEVRQTWEQIKAEEKGESLAETQRLSRKFRRYARTLPPLMAALKISTKAAAAGFEWDTLDEVWEKFHEELDELRAEIDAGDRDLQRAELGDLLFSLVQVARWQDLDPSEALQETNRKFVRRLEIMETLSDRPLTDCTLAELDALWNRAKAQLLQQAGGDRLAGGA